MARKHKLEAGNNTVLVNGMVFRSRIRLDLARQTAKEVKERFPDAIVSILNENSRRVRIQ